MKKLLFSLLMLCYMTAAWAGTGDGSRKNPYSGEWQASELIPKLKIGNHLAYDCEIIDGKITVYDDKLNNAMIIPNWSTWSVKYAIAEESLEVYNLYYSLNSSEERKNQTFIITDFDRVDETMIYITGHFSGQYDRGDGTKENPYRGEWDASEIEPKLLKGTYLAYDCVIKNGYITVIDSRLKQTVAPCGSEWSPENLIGNPQSGSPYEQYGKDNTLENRKKQLFRITDVIRYPNSPEHYDIKGYFSGFYSHPDDEGFFIVTTAGDLKSVIQKDNAAKVRLGDDIDISSLDSPLCDEFNGTITGKCDDFDPETHEAIKTVYMFKGKHTGDTKYSLSSRLFNKVKHATFEDIILSHICIHADEEYLGIIAKVATQSKFKNLMADSCSMFNNQDGVGVIAGNGVDSSFENVLMQSCDVTTDARSAGSVVGVSSGCSFTSIACGTTVYVFADGGGKNGYSGGITGHSYFDTFTNCSHMGLVGANDNCVGGITGWSHGSEFLSCTNCAIVATCDGDEFVEMQEQRNNLMDIMDKIDAEDIAGSIAAGTGGTIATGTGLKIATFLLKKASDAALRKWFFSIGVRRPAEFVSAPVAGYFVIGILVGLTAVYIYYDATGDDYAGGIVGYAEQGTVEKCANFGFINAIDKFVGGIAGDASNMVINNCLNAGNVNQERDNHWIDGPYRVGSIIGRGRDNTKVSNCLSTASYHITGASEENYRLDQTSGNNYVVGQLEINEDREFLERCVNQDIVENGLVAFWLNNGTENREKGIRPWHQNLWARHDNGVRISRDTYPVFNETHDEVTIDLFYDNDDDSEHVYHIGSVEKLQQFAADVNSGNSSNGKQFLIGYLENDIDMTGKDWTPIGKNEDFKNFRGIFNGRGHKITGLACSSTDQPVGLFGSVFANAYICNVTIGEGSSFTCDGDAGAGGIVGYADISGRKWGNVVIENCISHADINVNKHGGGILGRVEASGNENIKVYVNNCYSMGTVTAENGNSALLCGYTQHSGNISNSWSSGQLRNGSNKGIWPYSIENDDNVAECLVGYSNSKINIKGCYIVNPEANVDRYVDEKNERPLQTGVTILSEIEVANGKLAYLLNENEGKSIWQQNIATDPYPVRGDRGFYHTRTVSNQYGTAYLPFAVKSDNNISYYTFETDETDEEEGVKLKFAYAENVPARTPVLFRISGTPTAENPVEIAFYDANGEYKWQDIGRSIINKWTYTGTYIQEVFTEKTSVPTSKKVYYISGGKIKNAKNTTIAPYRAYFIGPNIDTFTDNSGSLQAKAIQFVIEEADGSTTAIEFVGDELDNLNGNLNGIYNLAGQKVDGNYQGIVIKNGKKVLRK